MREFFVAFRSRSDAVRYMETLKTYSISAKVINTPSSAKVGCGLSVKLFVKDMSLARNVLERGRFQSVIGIYYLMSDGRAQKM